MYSREELDQVIEDKKEILLSLDPGGEEWMRVCQERRELLLERIRLHPEWRVLLRPEFHTLVDSPKK